MTRILHLQERLKMGRILLVMCLMMMVAGSALAQSSTPVPIVVDTNPIFQQANNWIEIFGPIIAIGVGISIAIAILTFIGNQIIKAFKQ